MWLGVDLRGDLKGFRVAGLHLPSCKGADCVSVVEKSSTYRVKPNYLLDWGMAVQFPSLPNSTSVLLV